jgi:hypothetical protein
MTSIVSTLAPLTAGSVYTSPSVPATGAGGTTIVGTVFSDQPGTVSIQQSFDNVNFDVHTNFGVTGGVGEGINVTLIAPFDQVVYTNDSEPQTVFRLYVDLQDDNGNFVAPQTPSDGGEYVVLMSANGGWKYIGRFDGGSGWDACANAAIQNNASGTYAAFDIATGVVASESIVKSTEAVAASFS